MNNDLREHTVIVWRDEFTFSRCRNHVNVFLFRHAADINRPRARTKRKCPVLKAYDSFCIHSRFNRITLLTNFEIGNIPATRDTKLLGNDVYTGHVLGDGMFDLQTRVHFHKVNFICVEVVNKLDSSRTYIIYFACNRLRVLYHRLKKRVGQ